MSGLYKKFKQSLLSQSPSVDLDDNSTTTIKAAVVSASDYTVDLTSHQYFSSVTRYSGTTDQAVTTRTVTDGVFDGDDVTFSSVSIDGSKTINGIILYKDTGVAGTSPLIAFIDVSPVITPNGGSITIAWSSGSDKIFAL